MKKLFLILLLPLSVYSQSTQEQIDSLRYYMHKELNEYRLQNNVNELELSDSLNDLAQSWAKTMFETGKFEHSNIYPSGENILRGNDYSPTQLISKLKAHWKLYHWKESPGHNRNLLKYNYTKVGYGFYKGYAVQMFSIWL